MFGAARTTFIGQAAALMDSLVSVQRVGKAVEAFGNTNISTAQSKFGNSSYVFDGTSDSLKVTSDLDDFSGVGAFTFEFWFRLDDFDQNYAFLDTRGGNNSRLSINLFLWSGAIQLYQNGFINWSSQPTYSSNTWYHVAVCKALNSSSYELFVNGTSYGTVTGQSNLAAVDEMNWGLANDEVNFDVDGYLEEIRVSNTVRYTTGFTPQTSAHTNDANTLLLLHGDGINGTTAFIDDINAETRADSYSSNVTLAVPFSDYTSFDDYSFNINSSEKRCAYTSGDAADISNADTSYWTSEPDYVAAYQGGGSAGSALTYALSTSIPSCASGSNNYVVECWVKAESSGTNSNWCLSSADSGGRWLFNFNTGTTISFGNENNIGIGTNWTHVAIVLKNGTKKFYLNGVYKGAWTSGNTGFSTLNVGQFNSGDVNDFQGKLQDLRVTIGSDRGYTGNNSSSANFTLPSSIIEVFN